MTTIGSYAFYGTGLTSVKLPDNLLTIDDHAFQNCYSLSEVTIPASVTELSTGAFYLGSSVVSKLNFENKVGWSVTLSGKTTALTEDDLSEDNIIKTLVACNDVSAIWKRT